MSVNNPLLLRIGWAHPGRPYITADDALCALLEWARGRMSSADAQAYITEQSGAALDATEIVQAQDLVASFSGQSVASQSQRMYDLHNVLYLINIKQSTWTGYNPATPGDLTGSTSLALGTAYTSNSAANGGKLALPLRVGPDYPPLG